MSDRLTAATKALWEANHAIPFEAMEEGHRRPYRREAEKALTAADSVMFSEAAIVRIEAALYEHREGSLSCYDHIPSSGHYVWCCVCGEHEITSTWREHMARAVVAALREQA
jgi:hypothetical protein